MNTSSIGSVLITLVVGLGIGYIVGKAMQEEVPPIEVVENKIVEVEKIVYRDLVVEKKVESTETRPDGTVIQTVETSTSNETASEHTTSTSNESSRLVNRSKKYSLGIEFPLKFSTLNADMVNVSDVRLTGGYRLIGPIWVRGSVTPVNLLSRDGEVTLGVSIDL